MTLPTTPPPGRIDAHNMGRQFETRMRKMNQDPRLSDRNRQLIRDFLRDCELGKTVQRSQKKKIGKGRIVKYLYHLFQLALWFEKDFDTITQPEMEEFVVRLENGVLTRRDGKPFTESVKRDFKICLRKFYKWLLGDNEVYPKLVSWMDTREVITEIPSLRREEIERLSAMALTPRDRALVWVLYDSGARIEELLNIRYHHLQEVDSENQQKVFRVRIEFSKTKPRTILLPIASPYLRIHLELQGAKDSGDQVFPITYGCLNMMLRRLGKEALGRPVHPHLFRHSSSTYYAPLLSRAAFCYRYGWAYSSKMADRYIDREALNDQESVRSVTNTTMDQLTRENTLLMEDLASLRDRLNQIDLLMGSMTTDPEVLSLLAQKVRDHQQSERLSELRMQVVKRIN